MTIIPLPLRRPWWPDAAQTLWPAWQSLIRWEEIAADELGLPFG